jgi:hypothetical protein
MRPNASVKMRPVGELLLRATWIATCNRDCQKPDGARQSAGASYGNSFTLPLFATRSEVLGGFSPPARLIRCIGIQNNPPKSQICHAICRDWKSKSTALQSAPTAGSQGKADHTPNVLLRQAKTFTTVRLPRNRVTLAAKHHIA